MFPHGRNEDPGLDLDVWKCCFRLSWIQSFKPGLNQNDHGGFCLFVCIFFNCFGIIVVSFLFTLFDCVCGFKKVEPQDQQLLVRRRGDEGRYGPEPPGEKIMEVNTHLMDLMVHLLQHHTHTAQQ